MIIELELNQYCIETAAKKAYEYFLSRYFKKGRDTSGEAQISLETRIERLKYFLEYADFGFLRSRHPELSGFTAARVILMIPQNMDALTIKCGTQIIAPKWRSNIRSDHSQGTE